VLARAMQSTVRQPESAAAPFDMLTNPISISQGGEYTPSPSREWEMCSFVCDFTISSLADDGVIFEAGGSSNGIICYLYGGTIYVNSHALSSELEYTPPSTGTYEIGVSGDVFTDELIRLYVDGVVVDSGTATDANYGLTGTDDFGCGKVAGTGCITNQGGWSSSGHGTFSSNTIANFNFYLGKPSADFTDHDVIVDTQISELTGKDLVCRLPLVEINTDKETQLTLSAYVEVNSTSDDGIIYESGGTGDGLMVYLYGGTLYAQAGTGDGYTSTTSRAVCTYTLPSTGDYRIVFSVDVQTQDNAVLIVNGTQQDSDSVSNDYATGTNDGGVGKVFSSCCVNAAGWTTAGQGQFSSNVVRCVHLYPDQILSSV